QDRFNLNESTLLYPKGMFGINGGRERSRPPVIVKVKGSEFYYYLNDSIETTWQQSDEFFPCIASPENILLSGDDVTDGILDGDVR
ncbi:MAG: hypothetical protein V4651_12075, partial [Bacteroidota bacterium]